MSPIAPTTRLHYQDTFLFRFEAEVLAARPSADGLEVALDRTAFYVESGGQPPDRGRLAGWEVVGVSLEEGVVWHHLRASASEAPAPGARVAGEVDPELRLDHMQQHTGQHILSRSFLLAGGGGTRSFHLGREESTIDLDGEKPEPALLERAGAIANRCVLEDRPVRIVEATREELSRYPLRRDPGEDRDVQRLIEIEEFDWSACGGTHARRTGEVGPIQILGAEKVRGLWRIRFLAGYRTLRYLAAAHRILSDVAREHSLHPLAIPEAARQWKAEAVALTKEVSRLRAERGAAEARRLFDLTPAEPSGVRVVRLYSENLGSEELRSLANTLVSLGPAIVLAGGREEDSQFWVFARSPELPGTAATWDAAGALKSWLSGLSGRGGGNMRFAVGTCRSPMHLETSQVTEDLHRFGVPTGTGDQPVR